MRRGTALPSALGNMINPRNPALVGAGVYHRPQDIEVNTMTLAKRTIGKTAPVRGTREQQAFLALDARERALTAELARVRRETAAAGAIASRQLGYFTGMSADNLRAALLREFERS